MQAIWLTKHKRQAHDFIFSLKAWLLWIADKPICGILKSLNTQHL